MNARDPHHESAAPLAQVNATTQRYRNDCAAQAQAMRRELAELDARTARAVEAGDAALAAKTSDAAATLAPLGEKAHVSYDMDDLVRQITAASRHGDQILVMSNGGFGGIHDKLLAALALP